MNQAAATPSPALIDAFAAILKYGPLGLAGLLLILVFFVLSFRTITAAQERILKLMMFTGAGCFVLALAASFFSPASSYDLYFNIYPIQLVSNKSVLPQASITANGTTIDENTRKYIVTSNVVANIDVSAAFEYARKIQQQNISQRNALGSISPEIDALNSDLQRIPGVIENNCPGGAQGVSAPSNQEVLKVVAQSSSSISKIRASLATVGAGSN